MENESWNGYLTVREIREQEKKEWQKIVDKAYNEWKKDTSKTIDEIVMKYVNDDNIVDFVYGADEETILASCIADKERWQIFPHIYKEPNDKQIHQMWEITKRALHTCLFKDVYKKAELDGYDVSEQVLVEHEEKEYEQNQRSQKPQERDLGEER